MLARSLEGEWEGVRIPRGAVDGARSERECALDIFCDHCDLLPEELYISSLLPPQIASRGLDGFSPHASCRTDASGYTRSCARILLLLQ